MGNDFCEHHGGMLRSHAQAEAPAQAKPKLYGRAAEWAWIDEVLGVDASQRLERDRTNEVIIVDDPYSGVTDASRDAVQEWFKRLSDQQDRPCEIYQSTAGEMVQIDPSEIRNSDRQTWATQTPDGHTVYFQGRHRHLDAPAESVLEGDRTITETVTAFDRQGREIVVSRRTRSYNLGSLSGRALDRQDEVFHVVDEYGLERTVRRGELVRAPSSTGKLLLQEQCRSCRYRNRDFDEMVGPEHLKDLRCGVNPSYAESGVGECGDFEGEGDRNA